MRLLTAVLLLIAGAVGTALCQPGDDGILSVNVVDEKGVEIRGAALDEATIGSGRPVFIGRVFPTATERGFKPLFKPRDEYRSSFIANTHCKGDGSYSIKISAPGYDSKIVTGAVKSCDLEVEVKLARSTEPLPAFEPLTVLSGKLVDQRGRPITRRFIVVREGKEYVPKIKRDGSYSMRLSPGLYEILFNEYRCTEYAIRNFRIGSEPRTLNFTPDCE